MDGWLNGWLDGWLVGFLVGWRGDSVDGWVLCHVIVLWACSALVIVASLCVSVLWLISFLNLTLDVGAPKTMTMCYVPQFGAAVGFCMIPLSIVGVIRKPSEQLFVDVRRFCHMVVVRH